MLTASLPRLPGSKRAKEENLKEMGDVTSGMASTVIQLYLKQVLASFLDASVAVRHAALKVSWLAASQRPRGW